MTLDACEQEDVDYSDLRECVTLWAVSVPGEAAWCSEVASGSTIGALFCPCDAWRTDVA
jgi:hypothetical protein